MAWSDEKGVSSSVAWDERKIEFAHALGGRGVLASGIDADDDVDQSSYAHSLGYTHRAFETFQRKRLLVHGVKRRNPAKFMWPTSNTKTGENVDDLE